MACANMEEACHTITFSSPPGSQMVQPSVSHQIPEACKQDALAGGHVRKPTLKLCLKDVLVLEVIPEVQGQHASEQTHKQRQLGQKLVMVPDA
eukprot:1058807-Amphidinium_carterae.2